MERNRGRTCETGHLPFRGRPSGRGGALTAVGLVAAILAVGVAVAAPLAVDALARAALRLAGGAPGGRGRGAAAAVPGRLVRLVLAVHVLVADPAGGNAGGVAALELAGPAGGGRAVRLVAAVAAVVLAVAHEVARDAAAAGAGELQGGAGDVTWVRKGTLVSGTSRCAAGRGGFFLLNVAWEGNLLKSFQVRML